ncbi:MAG: hypothetical protein V4618_13555 [Pseudomonadota bacterium]
MDRGPNNISRPLCAIDPLATFETPPTHYMMQDMSAMDTETAIWQVMAEEGTLPPIAGEWGVGGVISEVAAETALASGNLQTYIASGIPTPELRDAWRNGVLLGAGLQFLPDEPL